MRKIELADIEGIWRHNEDWEDFYIDFAIRIDRISQYSIIRKGDSFMLSHLENNVTIDQNGNEDATLIFDEYIYPIFYLDDKILTLDYGDRRGTFNKLM